MSNFAILFFGLCLTSTPIFAQQYQLEDKDTIAVDTGTNKVLKVLKTDENEEDTISPEEQVEQIEKLNKWIRDEDVDTRFLSHSVDFENIRFILFTRENPTKYILKIGHNETLKSSTYNKMKKTKILIHGWIQKGQSFIDSFKTAYLKNQDVNLIFVDWGEYSKNEYQYTIMRIVPRIGEAIELMIKQLIAYGASVSDMHIIGFSLGVQISSYAVKNLNLKIARITGLDPAGIGYTGAFRWPRLSKFDADFVDVIHTNGGMGGITAAIGHADFYPNGGRVQPGCVIGNFICYHMRSIDLFKESIENRTRFIATSCSSYNDYRDNFCHVNSKQIMGEYASHKASGKYYLQTNKESPFAIERENIRRTTWRPIIVEVEDDV